MNTMAGEEQEQSIEEALGVYRQEVDRLRREMSEIDVMVRQNTTDVDKLAQREITVANRVRDLEVNLEKYSKAEIKNFYTTAQEVQMRLHMMRAQLDQLKDRQKTMQERYELIEEFLELLENAQGIAPTRTNGDNEGEQRSGDNDNNDVIVNIIQAQEEERRRISLQMHDGPAQSMANLVLRAEICQRLLEKDAEQARSELAGLKTAINTMLQDIRKFVFDLHPMTLEDLGLVPTIRRFASEFGEKNNLEVNIMVNGLESRMPIHYEVTLFRFIQEALNNVARHAQAHQVRVLLNVSEEILQIIVEDDGEGFHVNEVLSDDSGRRNLGITGMRQQIEVLLRGEFGIESAIGRGTRVAGNVPLSLN
jgi:two-component system sensor histidine kinase DegS